MASLETYPLDMVAEILTKLPVKSLLRFRCVCKSWDVTITDPVFSKLHQSRPCLFIADWSDDPYMFTCLSCDGIDDAVTNVSAPWEDRLCKYDLLGCCNGLICLYDRSTRESTLWNPSTRKFKTLPPLTFGDGLQFFYGFGYDEVTDDYKVVQWFIEENSKDVGDHVFIFSLKSDAWRRRIPNSNICPSSPGHSYGELLGGALHWLAISGDIIIAFDLAKEKCEGLPRPERGSNSFTVIGVLGEHLCLCYNHLNGGGVGVWIMKEYGVKSSWTKMFQVPHETLRRYGCNYRIEPFLFSKEGEIVAMVRGTGVAIVRFNIRDLRFKDLMLCPNNPHNCAFLYRESLVSPLVSHQV